MQPPSGGCVLKLFAFSIKFISLWQPPSGGCVLKQQPVQQPVQAQAAAAFGRLCVETALVATKPFCALQPPSGGCVLKQSEFYEKVAKELQPPSGGCVLKLADCAVRYGWGKQPPSGGCVLKQLRAMYAAVELFAQPPSGGCVLKPRGRREYKMKSAAAAFGRLCVETNSSAS